MISAIGQEPLVWEYYANFNELLIIYDDLVFDDKIIEL